MDDMQMLAGRLIRLSDGTALIRVQRISLAIMRSIDHRATRYPCEAIRERDAERLPHKGQCYRCHDL